MWVAIVLLAALFASGATIHAHNNQEIAHLKQEVHYLRSHNKPKPMMLDGIAIGDLKKGDNSE